eukprot:gb/GEZN01011106.1/.p1 GENE.gb/GEZN01011106.1/~~gb/GEZN01011106.1/.p1  ORF type:complete len:327 (+),score=54.68 gb/GEZN01011106.1/:73-1053(+)
MHKALAFQGLPKVVVSLVVDYALSPGQRMAEEKQWLFERVSAETGSGVERMLSQALRLAIQRGRAHCACVYECEEEDFVQAPIASSALVQSDPEPSIFGSVISCFKPKVSSGQDFQPSPSCPALLHMPSLLSPNPHLSLSGLNLKTLLDSLYNSLSSPFPVARILPHSSSHPPSTSSASPSSSWVWSPLVAQAGPAIAQRPPPPNWTSSCLSLSKHNLPGLDRPTEVPLQQLSLDGNSLRSLSNVSILLLGYSEKDCGTQQLAYQSSSSNSDQGDGIVGQVKGAIPAGSSWLGLCQFVSQNLQYIHLDTVIVVIELEELEGKRQNV